MTAAWKIDATSTDKLVLLALADWANGEGLCWPSIKQLADKSGLAERGLQMAIKRLCEAGHLTRCEVTGKGVNYTVHPRTTCTPAKDAPPHETTQTPARRAPNTVSNHHKSKKATPSHSRRAKPKANAIELPEGVTVELWNDYRAMRQRKRAPMTPKAESLMLAKLVTLKREGHDPAAVIEQSIMNAWTGLFELKGMSNAKRPMDGGTGQPTYRRSHGLDMLRELRAEIEADEGSQGVHHGAILALPLPARH